MMTTSTTDVPDTSDIIYFECPRCLELVRLERPIRYSADEFCKDCDYPLFWTEQATELMARPVAAPAATVQVVEQPPGVEKTEVACPRCEHPNAASAGYCASCGAAMVPRERNPAEVWWMLAAVLAVSAVAATVILLLLLL